MNGNRSLECLALLLVVLFLSGNIQAAEGVKLLYGFEIQEMLPKKSRTKWYVGKVWPKRGSPKSGWRFEDHKDELSLPPDHEGDVTLYETSSSRDYPRMTLYHTGATQGKHAFRFLPPWKYASQYASGKSPGITAQPAPRDYHGLADWYYQRCCQVWDDALRHRSSKARDWTGYQVIRFDIFCPNAPTVLGMRVMDCGAGPKAHGAYQGLRAGLTSFNVPKAKQVTCEFPLAEMTKIAEMDLSNMQGFNIRINGFKGQTDVYLDNVRLVKKEAMGKDLKLTLIKMEGEIKPFARKVMFREPLKISRSKMKRVHEKTEKAGPVTVYEGTGGYACAKGHFGGSGSTYFQNCRRGIVAYDDGRLIVLLKGSIPKNVRRTGTLCEGGGMLAFGSFDGGKTWGGVMEGENTPLHLANWYWRASGCADESGSLYLLGTQNCTSYHERYDVFLRRMTFTGDGWVEDRFTIADQNLQKCPGWARALKLQNGRIWAAWTEGWGGILARYSDDDGYTWEPCKDASVDVPRPFYRPKLEDLKKPEAERNRPPEAVLLWPTAPVLPKQKSGGILVPYKDGVAVFSSGGTAWQIHDRKKWGSEQKIDVWQAKKLGVVSETVVGDRIFLARSAGYSNPGKETLNTLETTYLEGGEWKHEILENENIADSILTASGESAFCFYVKKAGDAEYEVRYRRWRAGKWGPSVVVATEKSRINHVAAPQICPPNYACVFWDQMITVKKQPTWVRFAKIPYE